MKQTYQQLKIAITVLLFFLVPALTFGQTKLSGTVTDENKQPIPGVTIKISGTEKGTVTDVDGHYFISAEKGQTLVYSFVGYATTNVVITDKTVINVSMLGDSKTLNEVVVTAFGVKKETRVIGYATQTVAGSQLTTARDPNPINGLIGKVAGLSVSATSEVLGVPNVTIRGNTVSLYVVDGLPINSDTFDLSPDDIESYTVLKGPAAAALYGSRAQYGAIVITTKKGNKEKKGLTVDINSSTVMNKGFLAFPQVQHLYGPGENEFYEFVDGKGGAPGGVDSDYDVWGPYFNGQLIPQYDSPVINGVRQGTPWTARGANNLANFLQTGYQLNNDVAITANGDNYTTRFSVSQQHQTSYIPSQYLDIGNANFYAQFRATPRLTFEASVDFNRQSTDNFPDVQYGPNSIIYNLAIWTGADWNVNAPDIKAIWQPGKTNVQSEFAEYTRYHNPYLLTEIWTRGHHKNDTYGYISGNYKVNNNINISLKNQVDTYSLLRTEDLPYSAHPYGREGNMGDYREDRRNLFEDNTLLTANYDYTIKNFLNLSGLVGGNYRNFKYNSSWVSTDYLSVPNVYNFNNSLNPIQATSFVGDSKQLSGFASLDASFGKYFTLSGTYREERSSAFQHVTTYGYPSASATTVISDYVKLPEVITFLKARFSYASIKSDLTSATIGPAPYSNITAFGNTPNSSNPLFSNPLDYGTTYDTPYNGPTYQLSPGYTVGKPYNSQAAAYGNDNLYAPSIQTFTRINYEEGFDIKFLKNRLGLSATAFQYIDGPQILQNTISTTTGYEYEYLNALKTKKTGYEFSISGTPIKDLSGFGWDVLVNWSTYKQVYKELPPGEGIYNTFFKVGDRTDKFYGTDFVRNPQGQIINSSPDKDGKGGGEPLVNPVPQYLGHLDPDYTWSIYNNFHYKSFSLGVQFDGSVGGVTEDYVFNKTVRGGSNALTAEGAFGAARYQDWLNFGKAGYAGSYIGQGVQISNGVAPVYNSTTGAVQNYGALQYAPNNTKAFLQEYVSEYYNVASANLMSKTYAKLREVTFTYNLPKKLLKNTFIQNASATIYGRNLLYFYKDSRFKDVDLDQYANTETTLTGLQSPSVRSYGLNIKLSF